MITLLIISLITNVWLFASEFYFRSRLQIFSCQGDLNWVNEHRPRTSIWKDAVPGSPIWILLFRCLITRNECNIWPKLSSITRIKCHMSWYIVHITDISLSQVFQYFLQLDILGEGSWLFNLFMNMTGKNYSDNKWFPLFCLRQTGTHFENHWSSVEYSYSWFTLLIYFSQITHT